VDLRTVEEPPENDDLNLDGLILPRQHPSIIFSDCGGLKSYAALWLVSRLAGKKIRVSYFDWELKPRIRKSGYIAISR
jgi:hypothetical protein